MKSSYFFLLVLLVGLSSCELAGDIFQAGMWTTVIVIVLVIVLVLWLLRRFRR